VLPPAPVERSGEPHGSALRLVDLGPGDQIVHDRGHGEPDPDADQDQAVPVDTPLVREHVHQRRGAHAADDRAERHLEAARALDEPRS
jgi:hypothetical protein